MSTHEESISEIFPSLQRPVNMGMISLGRVLRGIVDVCPHVEEMHARKWKLYASTQDTVTVSEFG
jgi:hypothetical protein